MKKFNTILAGLLMSFTAGCSKYLDVQEDFSDSDTVKFVLSDNGGQVRRFHAYIYNALTNYSAYYGGDIGNGLQNPWVILSDDMVAQINGNLKNIPTNGYLSTTAPHHRWHQLYRVIRAANIYLANARTVGKAGEANSISEDEMNRLKAEALVMRAYSHYLLFELYGPVPVMSDIIVDASDTSQTFARNSVDEVIQAITDDIDKALSLNALIETHVLSTGAFDNIRITVPTKGVALAIKAKALVLAASPLYNGGYTEALSLTNTDGKRLFPNHDPNKWVKAKDALEALFTYANAGNYELYKSRDNDPHLNVYELFQNYNKEIIWANVSQNWNNVDAWQTPRDIQVPAGNSTFGNLGVTQEMVDAFFMNNGLKIDDPGSGYTETGKSNVLNPATLYVRSGVKYRLTDPNISNMYANREPRFYAAVTYQGKSWHDVASYARLQGATAAASKATRVFFSKDIESTPVLPLGYREKASSNNKVGGYPLTGYLAYKFNARNIHPTASGVTRNHYRTATIFRLADFYLLYAEVLNEINPGDPKIVEYLDKVRERAGIPGYQTLQNTGRKIGVIGNQTEMRKAIQHERRVELFAEGQRYFDVRRWLIADKPEGRQGGHFTGMNMEGNESDGTFYQRVNCNPLPRIFERKMYLYPIPFSEIQNNKGKLVQNPGW